MTTHKQNDPMISRIKQELDAGLDQLDPSITSRLREGRSKALEQTVHKPFWERLFVHPRQLAGFATAAALLVMVMYWHPSRSVLPDNRVEEMELLAQQGSLDMYQDLDFYAWLATTNETH
jgi:hypothetical protein